MKLKYLMLVLLPIIIVFIILSSIDCSNSDNRLKIYVFDAGKADAIILTKNGKTIMIDTGEESLTRNILSYLNNNNITRIDYLIITHFDKDHVGSASNIIDNIEIGEVLQSNVSKDSSYYDSYISSLYTKGIEPITVSGDYLISFSGLDVVVNGPSKVYDSSESNNSSLIVSITDGSNSFLFMGDSENARIKDFISSNSSFYDFIKVPYHGNYLKQLDNLLESTGSKYGVVTCSNSEGCDDRTISLLEDYGVEYYLTKNGSVTIYSDGNSIEIKQ